MKEDTEVRFLRSSREEVKMWRRSGQERRGRSELKEMKR